MDARAGLRDGFLELFLGSACVACGKPGSCLCAPCHRGLPRTPKQVRPTPCPDGLTQVFAAGEYTGAVRDLLLAHKERRVYGLARPLGVLLAQAVRLARSRPRAASSEVCVLVPVPSHPAVVRDRTHDPLLRLTREAARELRRDGTPVTIIRPVSLARQPADQAGLDATQRGANLATAFRTPRRPPAGAVREVFLADDIVTTGATLRELQRVLENAGWDVAGAVTVAATRRRVPFGGTPPIHV